MQGQTLGREIYAAMQGGKPYKSYRKTILGKVYVTVIDPFEDKPAGVILEGRPDKEGEGIVDLWTQTEDLFFKKMNKRHLEAGRLIPYERKEEDLPKERTIEEFSDEELVALLKEKFFALQNAANKTESEAVLDRLIRLARANEKSEKTVNFLLNRLSEIQMKANTLNKEEIE